MPNVPNLKQNKKLYGVAFLSAVLCVAALFYSGVLKNDAQQKVQPKLEISEATKAAEAHEMAKKVAGCLTLSEEENKKVSGLARQIVDLKNDFSLGKDELGKLLNPLNIELNKLLNQYTLKKISQTDKNLLAIENAKKIMKAYKDAHSAPDDTISKIASYKIIDGEKIEKLADDKAVLTAELEKKVDETWDNIKKILPISALKKIARFEPFTNPQQEKEAKKVPETGQELGFIDPGNGQEGDTLGINLDACNSGLLPILAYTLYHEYGHAISLNASQRDGESKVEYQTPHEQLRFKENSYMKKFYDQFYKYTYDDQNADKEGYLFYLRHQNEFVSLYAASHYYDDFAESFASFVVGKDGFLFDNNNENGKEKIKLFEQFPELIELRDQIRALRQKYNIRPMKSTI
ncbi:hypothetical protein FACS189481_6000 [Clostridia bacterium]|nr:hypothetical protein FACS189481_6000 [Clostridia bacterium]